VRNETLRSRSNVAVFEPLGGNKLKATLIDQSGSTKTFKVEHNGLSVVIALLYVSTRKIVQAVHVDCDEGRITRWKPYGSFIQLIEKKLNFKISGTRQAFIDNIYFEARKAT
jgi:hypothetical protein